ncbi:MAG TPA: hypothetical protein PKV80_26305, partial [Leptospiraceae bacterium]|nr:hypothetical protein [Leptospiraceae bacterium]HNF28007.1 hypothetical protein [Leptospiraceae bacterium]HNI98823.1 hypothetical protein [Leptospiraceae bacterium]
MKNSSKNYLFLTPLNKNVVCIVKRLENYLVDNKKEYNSGKKSPFEKKKSFKEGGFNRKSDRDKNRDNSFDFEKKDKRSSGFRKNDGDHKKSFDRDRKKPFDRGERKNFDRGERKNFDR